MLDELAPSAHAQALSFETVGDRPLNTNGLAFDDADALWAMDYDLLRLPPGGAVWEEVNLVAGSDVLPLGPDTLVTGGYGGITRSTDGGQSFVIGFGDDGFRAFELPSGTLLAAGRRGSGVLRSTDRGATWAYADFDPPGSWEPEGEAFAAVPPGLPYGVAHEGRVAGAFWAGMGYSDDDGASWAESSLWG
ncbi:MAG: sialidase family protein, partial [Rubricoccaceae bacterium]|nr:sialidase family protein [Rubricoccaceae bacterium]